jgi:hypothetical protein
MRSGSAAVSDAIIGVIGLSLLVYGGLVTNRAVRLAGFIAVTACAIAAAIPAVFRDAER